MNMESGSLEFEILSFRIIKRLKKKAKESSSNLPDNSWSSFPRFSISSIKAVFQVDSAKSKAKLLTLSQPKRWTFLLAALNYK